MINNVTSAGEKRCGHLRTAVVCFLCLLFVVHPAPPVKASETDSFTGRCEPLTDATAYLNQFVGTGIDQAVKKANRDATRRYLLTNYPFNGIRGVDYCNSDDLYRQIRHLFARKFVGQMEAHINHLPDGMVRKTALDRSVYRDFPFEKAPTLVGTRNMGAVVRIGNHIVGADKFGHFFSEGWTEYRLAYHTPSPDFHSAVDYGEITESLYYGVMTTGVYSHADQVANFNGMRFYNAMVGDGDDPLGQDNMPEAYVKCLNKKWERVKDFDWRDYVDAAWDEGVNFNYLRDEELLALVLSRVEDELRRLPDDCDCNQQATDADALDIKYRNYAETLLNLDGLSVLPDALTPEHLVKERIHEALSHRFKTLGRIISQ